MGCLNACFCILDRTTNYNISIIKLTRKLMLSTNRELWIKSDCNILVNVAMASFCKKDNCKLLELSFYTLHHNIWQTVKAYILTTVWLS